MKPVYGLMQQGPLTLDRVVRKMMTSNGLSTVAYKTPRAVESEEFQDVAARVLRLASSLKDLGVRPGDAVATLAFNTIEHFEVSLAVPYIGSIYQAVNPRLSPDQIEYILKHADARFLFIEDDLLESLGDLFSRVPNLRTLIILESGRVASVQPSSHGSLDQLRYTDLLNTTLTHTFAPIADEYLAAGLCHTTGTTGHPKGVLYSHRSTLLHALSMGLADNDAISVNDSLLPLVPFYHANAWGLGYAAGLHGANLVLPGRDLSGKAVGKLIETAGVTIASGVPTVLEELLNYLLEDRAAARTLRLVVSGGAPLKERIVTDYESLGVQVVQGWGMTETSPNVSISRPLDTDSQEVVLERRLSAGRLNPLVEARIVDVNGAELPWDGRAAGEIQLKTPHGASGYFKPEEDTSGNFDGGWLRTGDVATIDAYGYVYLRDRIKDVIKSGGEYISSLEVERAVEEVPGVSEAVVVGQPDSKWGERPFLFVMTHPGSEVTFEQIQQRVADKVPSWWVPVGMKVVSQFPLTSVGKPNKQALRESLQHPHGQVTE